MNKSPNRQKTKQPNIQPSNQPTKQTQQTTPNQNKSNQAKPKQNKKETNQTNQPPNKPTNQPTHPPSQTNRQTDKQNKKRQSHRMKTTLVETTKSFKWVYKSSICQILNEPNAALAFCLICRRARRQRSQSPVLGTLKIYTKRTVQRARKTTMKHQRNPNYPLRWWGHSPKAHNRKPWWYPAKKKSNLYKPSAHRGPAP